MVKEVVFTMESWSGRRNLIGGETWSLTGKVRDKYYEKRMYKSVIVGYCWCGGPGGEADTGAAADVILPPYPTQPPPPT